VWFVLLDLECFNSFSNTTLLYFDLFQACKIIGLMVRHMSSTIFNYISRGHGVGIFTKAQGMGVYPENYHVLPAFRFTAYDNPVLYRQTFLFTKTQMAFRKVNQYMYIDPYNSIFKDNMNI
jgi:hypothetical protein